ncbi:MAG TPA: hypothetical protein PKC70_01205 [Cellvibrionaceae bacterium]|nr:hypothetical protein [Cellvibrionaceae bacterium]HNG58547.1 hypothetical protein [Cellvibrionaceae bacterium]
MKKIIAVSAMLLSCSSLSISVSANEEEVSAYKKLKGCYTVVRATMEESSVDASHVIGTYKFILVPKEGKKKTLTISGPVSGAEASGSHEEGESDGEIHGGHVFGTKNRLGTFSSGGDEFEVTSAKCPDAEGNPKLIEGIETISFEKGTGIFSGLKKGIIPFNTTFDACTDPSNPVGDLYATSGELCFE